MKNPNQIDFDNVNSFLDTLKNIKKYDKSQVKKLAKIFFKSSDNFLLFEQDFSWILGRLAQELQDLTLPFEVGDGIAYFDATTNKLEYWIVSKSNLVNVQDDLQIFFINGYKYTTAKKLSKRTGTFHGHIENIVKVVSQLPQYPLLPNELTVSNDELKSFLKSRTVAI